MHGQTVFIDLTFMTNLGADFLLLYFTAILSGSQIRWGRLLAAAGTGTVYALFFVLYPDSLWVSPLPRLLFALVMVFIAYSPMNRHEFIRAAGFFYLLSFLAGGAAYAFSGLGFTSESFKALPWALLIASLLTVIAHRWLTHQTLTKRHLCTLEIKQGEQNLIGTGLVDTGNSLADPLSGRPVIIAEYTWIKPLLSEEVGQLIQSESWNSAQGAEVLLNTSSNIHFRLLPYRSIGKSEGMLMAITCDQVKIIHQKRTRVHNQVLVAISLEGLSQENNFLALIPAALT